MNTQTKNEIPLFISWLMQKNYINTADIQHTNDGFCVIYKSIASILALEGIHTYPDRDGLEQECRYFFDDWFLFSVTDREDSVYGLFKMREQEDDLKRGLTADGDTPGVTVSFIAFDSNILKMCLQSPTSSNRKQLGMEINRVVAYPNQTHHAALKAYFISPQSEGAYLIADLYVAHIASFSKNGVLAVPEAYRDIYKKRTASKKHARVPDFLDQTNRNTGKVVCDHQRIYIHDANHLSELEKLSILATHTGNVSIHSFAAEVRFHAMFLAGAAKVKLPLIGAPYASAVRADMSIGDKEFQGLTPYYDLSGKLVREQMQYHKNL